MASSVGLVIASISGTTGSVLAQPIAQWEYARSAVNGSGSIATTGTCGLSDSDAFSDTLNQVGQLAPNSIDSQIQGGCSSQPAYTSESLLANVGEYNFSLTKLQSHAGATVNPTFQTGEFCQVCPTTGSSSAQSSAVGILRFNRSAILRLQVGITLGSAFGGSTTGFGRAFVSGASGVVVDRSGGFSNPVGSLTCTGFCAFTEQWLVLAPGDHTVYAMARAHAGSTSTSTPQFVSGGVGVDLYFQFISELSAIGFTSQPPDRVLPAGGGSVGFFASHSTGGAPSTWQWYRIVAGQAVALSNGPTGTGSTITGANSSNLDIASAGIADVGSYFAVIEFVAGRFTSNIARLSEAPVTQGEPPYLLEQPQSAAVPHQSQVRFTTVASSVSQSGTTQVQWRRNGQVLTDGPTPWGSHVLGSTKTTLILSNVSQDDNAVYTCDVTNTLGSVTSDGATLTVAPGPCLADLTGSAIPGSPGYGVPDGLLTNEDFFYYLTLFSENVGNLVCPTPPDLTGSAIPGGLLYGSPNGELTNDDFFYYISLFAAGC